MNRLISILILTLITISAFSQKLKIDSFSEKPTDLSARTNQRNDANDNPCALIKVQVALRDVEFRGNVIGDVNRDVSEYWVYMSAGTKHLKVMHPDYIPCDVTFADYGITSLASRTTYELVLIKPDGTSNNVSSSARPQTPQTQDSRAVDLGLSVKWASCNIGATKPEKYGDYFAWGETKPKASYTWSNLKYCSDSNGERFTKYIASSSYGTVDDKTTLDLSDDAAHVNWGGSWRMPTKAEQDELREKCTWTWTTQNGVKGYKVTSNINGNSIFLPAAGCRYNSGLSNAGSYGFYWSSSLYSSYSYYAYNLNFNSSFVYWDGYGRYYGRSVRAVCP